MVAKSSGTATSAIAKAHTNLGRISLTTSSISTGFAPSTAEEAGRRSPSHFKGPHRVSKSLVVELINSRGRSRHDVCIDLGFGYAGSQTTLKMSQALHSSIRCAAGQASARSRNRASMCSVVRSSQSIAKRCTFVAKLHSAGSVLASELDILLPQLLSGANSDV